MRKNHHVKELGCIGTIENSGVALAAAAIAVADVVSKSFGKVNDT